MPRFSANLTFQFNEVPFLDRFAAASAAGFRAVEFMFPYEHEPAEVERALQAAHVENVLFNLPAGDWSKGDRGLACVPGREGEFRESVATALRYAKSLKSPLLHAMAGTKPPEARTEYLRENVRLQSPLCGGSHYANAIFYYRKRGAPPRGLVRALEKAAEAKRQLTLRTARSIDARLKLSRSAAPRSNPKGSGHSHSVRRREELRSEALANLSEAETICRAASDDHGLGSVHIAGLIYCSIRAN